MLKNVSEEWGGVSQKERPHNARSGEVEMTKVCSSDRYNDVHRGWSIANEEEYQTGGSTLPAGP